MSTNKRFLVKSWDASASLKSNAQRTVHSNRSGFIVSCLTGEIYNPDTFVYMPYQDIASQVISDYISAQGWESYDLEIIADLCRAEIDELSSRERECFDQLEIALEQSMLGNEQAVFRAVKKTQPKTRALEHV